FLTRKLDTVLVSDLKGGEPFSSLPHAFRLGLVTIRYSKFAEGEILHKVICWMENLYPKPKLG
ncbi:hypothetical protein, partial [Microcoleus sp.]|uniref:hypothetical protein n=1 Tax=Microcoleus sp. TaxID=44472 RepID=UPI00403E5E99